MKTRIYLIMLVVALMAALVGGATGAWFTATTTNTNVTFTAGSLEITIWDQVYRDQLNPEIDLVLNNMAPGDVIRGIFDLDNDGTLPLKYKVEPIMEGALFTGSNPASVTFIAFNPMATTGDPHDLVPQDQGELGEGDAVTVTFAVTLPENAGNEYQGVSGNLKFRVHATQIENPHWNAAGTP